MCIDCSFVCVSTTTLSRSIFFKLNEVSLDWISIDVLRCTKQVQLTHARWICILHYLRIFVVWHVYSVLRQTHTHEEREGERERNVRDKYHSIFCGVDYLFLFIEAVHHMTAYSVHYYIRHPSYDIMHSEREKCLTLTIWCAIKISSSLRCSLMVRNERD